jgi:hypothetical protein
MAGQLSERLAGRPRLRRRSGWLLLVVAVLGVHACVTGSLAERMDALDADRALPPRLEVTYVREMALAAPIAAAPAAPAPAAAPRPQPIRRVAAPKPASAAEAMSTASSAASASLAEAAAAASAAPTLAAAESPGSPASQAAPNADQDSALAAASAASAPAFEWPASTRVTYLLTGNYRGEVQGSAQVEWVRVGSRYQVHVDFVVGANFAPLITQRSTSDGEITAGGLAPQRYDQDTQVLMGRRPRQTVLFEPGSVVLANGERQPTLPGVQDTASQFIQLTYLFSVHPELLKVGGSVDIPLALPKKVDVWTYDVVASEELSTPFGALAGVHLKPRGPRKPNALSVEMWFAPQLRYFPARLRFEQDAGTYVDLMIAKPPDMAN